MALFSTVKLEMVAPERALPGREAALGPFAPHLVLGTPITPPFPAGFEQAVFGLGCFWGAERRFWQLPGVYTTAVGYSGGYTPNPTYEEVCTGRTGHAEVVLVVFDPAATSYEALVSSFFEGHDPTEGMRQGNDLGTQYRSAVYVGPPGSGTTAQNTTAQNTTAQNTMSQRATAERVRDRYQELLVAEGHGAITTEIADAGPFYYAEEYHQQYLEKNPGGYCGLGGTGVACAVGPFGAEQP